MLRPDLSFLHIVKDPSYNPTRGSRTLANFGGFRHIRTIPEEEVNLAKAIQRATGVPEVGLSTKIPGLAPAVQGTHSNDNGDITWIVPHAHIHFPSNVPGVPFHHWCAAIAPATSIGHKGEVAGAKVLVGTLLDLLGNPELVKQVKECFDVENRGVKYEPLLPPDTHPPLDLNKQMMDGYREEMRKRYVNKQVKFVPVRSEQATAKNSLTPID